MRSVVDMKRTIPSPGQSLKSFSWFAGLYSFAAVVNVNLAVVNVLPIPALDGGYLLLLLVEVLRQGKKLPQEVEATFMASGFLLLTALGVSLILKDTLSFLR